MDEPTPAALDEPTSTALDESTFAESKKQWLDLGAHMWVAWMGWVVAIVVALIGLIGALGPTVIDKVWDDDAPAIIPFGEQVSGTYELRGPNVLLGVGPQIRLNAGTLHIGPTGATIAIEAFTGETSLGALGGESGVIDLQCEAILDTGTTPPTLTVTQAGQTYAFGYASDEQLVYLWDSLCGGYPLADNVKPLSLQFESYSDGMKTIVLTTPSQKLLWISDPPND